MTLLEERRADRGDGRGRPRGVDPDGPPVRAAWDRARQRRLLVADDTETQADGFTAPQARFAPLPRQAAIVHLLETAGGPVRVDPNGQPSVFPLLPPDEAASLTLPWERVGKPRSPISTTPRRR